ncbi:hypothetical protein BLA29_001300, partial [Euroglyphus maynei]
ESSDDDDIFVRPTIIKKALVSDEPDDDELFQTASISPSHHHNSLFGKDLEKQSEIQNDNNGEKSKINSNENILLNDSDDDSDDIFSSKTNRVSALKTTAYQSIFSSDDDDDDDLFNQLISKVPNKSEKQPDTNSLIINETISDSIPDLTSVSTTKIEKIQSKPELSNVIKELNSVIQNKVLSPNQETTIPSSSAVFVSDTNETKENIQVIDAHDELNSMLKHKLNLSSNRQRKPPSRNVLKASLSKSQSLFNDDDDDENSNSPVISKPETLKRDEKIEPKISVENLANNSAANKPTTITGTSKSFFDSSDSDDDDIFKGPNLRHIRNQESITKKTSILFVESDDDELDFQPFNSSKQSVPKITNKQPEALSTANTIKSQQTMEKKKSIFDDDSDSDGKNILY